MVRRAVGAFALIVVAAMSALVIVPTSSAEDADAEREPRPPIVATVALAPTPAVDLEEAYAVQVAVDAYLAAEHERQLAEFYADVQRQLDERAAALAAAARARPSSGGYHPGSTVGECTGFVIPDYIIQRESGGNPSAYNPSGAYGCAQTLLSHYSGGSCSGLDPYTIEGQRECVWRLSNGGTNLAPWAATR